MKASDRRGDIKSAARRNVKTAVLHDLVNVTWRMLAPTIAGLLIGMGLDGVLDSSPVGFLSGATIGFVIGLVAALVLLKRAEEMHV